MALAKDISFKGIAIAGAYHKITRAEVVAEGNGPPQLSCVVSVFRNKEDADAHANELERLGFGLGDFDKDDPKAAAEIAYIKLKELDMFSTAQDV